MSDGLYIPVATSMASVFKYLLDCDEKVDGWSLQDAKVAAIECTKKLDAKRFNHENIKKQSHNA